MANATPVRTGSVTRSTVARGARGVRSVRGLEGDFPRVAVRRTIPGRGVSVKGPTFDGLNGGSRPSGFIGRLRSGATTSL